MTFSDEGALVDQLLVSLRWWGPYQRVQFTMMMLPVLACAFHVMSVVFIGRPIEHRCTAPPTLNVTIRESDVWHSYDVMKNSSKLNLTVTYGACSIDVTNGSDVIMTTSCIAGYDYAEPREKSFASQWDLVCDQESLSDVSQTMLSLGMTFGAFIFTALADRYGRKPIYMISHFGLFLVAVAIAFSPNYTTFLVFRFLLGGLQQGTGLVSNIALIELMPKERRALVGEVGNFAWVTSLLVFCLVGFLCRELSWVYLELVLAGGSLFVLIQWWISDESLRWLVSEKKQSDVHRVLIKAARMNQVDTQKVMEILQRGPGSLAMAPITKSPVSISGNSLHGPSKIIQVNTIQVPDAPEITTVSTNGTLKTEEDLIEPKAVPELGLMAFVKNKRIVMITAISCYIWLTVSLSYYGMLLTSSTLVDDVYLGLLLSVAAEIPTCIVYIFMIDRYGRKRMLVWFNILAAISLIAATILSNLPISDSPAVSTIILCVSLVGKFAVSTAFGVVWTYTAELYPTSVRNTGFGISSLAARVGGMVAPYCRTFSRYVPWGPGAVFAGLCMIVPILMRFLPETSGEELPQTLADLDKWYEDIGRKKTQGRQEREVASS